jgi:hypothetical protein
MIKLYSFSRDKNFSREIVNSRAENVDDYSVAQTTSDHEEDVEHAEQVMQHRVGLFVTQPMWVNVRFIVGWRVPAVHFRLVSDNKR